MLHSLVEFLRHPDVTLTQLITHYGNGIYAVLFAIVFAETGLVFLPFLPGDSLLFALGALAARTEGGLSTGILYPLLFAAALCGDNVNYWLGRGVGRKLPFLKASHLAKTEAFFDKYGPKAIILARFVPIVRTFAPFVAGTGQMPYPRFLLFSLIGAALWVGICVTAGHFFGNFNIVKDRFDLVVLGIVAVSLVPMVFEFLNHRRLANSESRAVKP